MKLLLILQLGCSLWPLRGLDFDEIYSHSAVGIDVSISLFFSCTARYAVCLIFVEVSDLIEQFD